MTSHKRFANYPSLEDKVIVITGGANGIGASMVEHFAVQGSQVIILDIATEAATNLVQNITNLKVRHKPIFHQCDLTDVDNSIKPIATKILSTYPKIDGLINNAAGSPAVARTPTMSMTASQWDHSLNVNLRHHFFVTQALMPGLLASGAASIINMGSIAWKVPLTGAASYVTSKAGVLGLTRSLAHEFGAQGVRVNSIMPGSIATEVEKRDVHTPEYVAFVLGQQALKRLLQPEDVARAALWLLADDSDGVTGQNIVVDGGWT